MALLTETLYICIYINKPLGFIAYRGLCIIIYKTTEDRLSAVCVPADDISDRAVVNLKAFHI